MDSGAEAILLRESTAETHRLQVSSGANTTVMFGNGHTADTDMQTTIGRLPAIVCKDADLQEDLISVNPLLDAGFKLTMEGDQGILKNEASGETIDVTRDGARWSVNLRDLARATVPGSSPRSNQPYHTVEAYAIINTDPKSLRERVITLHERLGHANAEAMCDALSGDEPSWTHSDLTPAQVRRVMRRHKCLICHLAKRQRPPVAAPSGDRRDMTPGYCISGDIIPVSPPAHDGSTMFFLFADVCTGYMIVFTGKAKDSFLEAFKQAVAHLKVYGHDVRCFRSDAETVLKDGKMGAYLKEHGIVHELSTPLAHYQNFVERYVQTINKFTSALLHGQDLLQSKHWNWALFHAVDCRNRVPNAKSRPLSPYEMITGRKTNLQKTFRFTFGDLVAIHLPKETRNWKFDLRWDVGIYVGQPEHTVEAALVYFPFKNQLLVRTDVAKLEMSEEAYRRYYLKRPDMYGDVTSTATRVRSRLEEIQFDYDHPPEAETEDHDLAPEAESVPPTEPDETLIAESIPLMEPEEVPEVLRTEVRPRIRRTWDHLPPRRTTRSMAQTEDEPGDHTGAHPVRAYSVAVKAFAARASGPTVKEALESKLRDQWIIAMSDEIIETMLGSTMTLRPEEINENEDFKLIHTTMQLKIKMKTDVIVDKLKARLCACGNELDEVESETYSPTVSSLTHSFMLQIAVHDRMFIQLIDTKSAYLCQDYPQDVTPLYIKLPKRVAEAINLNPNQTYRVLKYIYGLPDAGRAYYDAYSSHLMENGFARTDSDPCLFFKIVGPRRRVYVWIHVDDTLIAADYLEDIEDFKKMMTKRFEITVNAEADHHLGVNITKLPDGSLKLTQSKLLNAIFEECEDALRSKSTRPTVPLKPTREADESEPYDRKQFLHLLGMLNYLLRSRPDIATALSYVASKSSKPSRHDYGCLLDVVRYLWKTRDHGLVIHPGDPHQPLKLMCYVDASFMSHDDSRGHSGYCLSVGDLSAFYSKSNKQPLVATSSTHAEVKALYQLVTDLIYLINLSDEIGRSIDLPAVIFEDNNPTVQLAGSLSARIKRSKHFLMLINFIRHQVTLGLVEVRKVATQDNVADVLTKPLNWGDFGPKAARLLGIPEEEFTQT